MSCVQLVTFFFKSYIFFPYPLFLVVELKKSFAVLRPETGEKKTSQPYFHFPKKEILKFFREVIYEVLRQNEVKMSKVWELGSHRLKKNLMTIEVYLMLFINQLTTGF